MVVHRDHAEQVVVGFGDGLAGPVPVHVTGLEVLVQPPERSLVDRHPVEVRAAGSVNRETER
jgi:hypothetical protein